MNFLKKLFKKPEISFNRKLTAKGVVDSINNGNYYELRNLLPRTNLGNKKLSYLQTFLLFGGMAIASVITSIVSTNPAPILLFLSLVYGSEYVFNSGGTDDLSCVLIDSTHFVVCYNDAGNSNYGTAIIGTITNDDEISYGSEYVFNSAATSYLSCVLIDSTHFVVNYRDIGNSGYGTAIIGTITNDDEISYGSEYVFNSANTYNISCALIDRTHFVICYNDIGNSNYGTAIIGTIANDDEISYGLEYVFNSAAIGNNSCTLINSTHFVICYDDIGNSNYGTAIIGTFIAVP